MKLSRSDLHGYQDRCVQRIKDIPACALFVEMGLGKTVSTLTAISELYYEMMINKVLVIAPLRVAESTWPDELEVWSHLKDLECSVATGTVPQRLAAMASPAPIHAINRENVSWLVDQYPPKKRHLWPYDTIVVDESSSFKNPAAKRFKALRKVRPHVNRVVLLTGTPAPNGYLDIWSQAWLLDMGQRLGLTYTAYRQRHFESDYMGYKWKPKKGAIDYINAQLEDICISLSAEDYLELPDRIDNYIKIDLDKKSRAMYEELEKEYFLEIEGDEITAVSAGVLSNKLLQLSNGAAYVDGQRWAHIHDAKLDVLDEIIEESGGEQILLAYNFKSDLERIFAHCKKKYGKKLKVKQLDKDPQTIRDWTNGEIDILCAHPASAGHGLNLQKGGAHIMVWFGLNWSLELYMQFNARLHRQGQVKPVIIHHIIVNDSIDIDVIDALSNKKDTQQVLLDCLKDKISQIKP